MKSVFAIAGSVMLAGAITATDAAAQDIPFDEVYVVVPWGPGGRTDVGTRIWAQHLNDMIDANVVVENRPGGGGVIGARSILESEPGSEIGVFSISHLIAQWTRIPPFELGEYTPVALPFESPFVLAVAVDSPYETLEDLIADSDGDRISIGNSGSGTSGHIAAAVFSDTAGIDARLVPYEGDAGAIAALLSDEVDAIMAPMIGMASQVEAGEIRPLAVSQEEVDVLHEGIPTFASAGVDFIMGDVGGGIYLPADTPDDVVQAWEETLHALFTSDEVVEALEEFFIAINFQTGEEFSDILAQRNPELEEIVDHLDLRLTQ